MAAFDLDAVVSAVADKFHSRSNQPENPAVNPSKSMQDGRRVEHEDGTVVQSGWIDDDEEIDEGEPLEQSLMAPPKDRKSLQDVDWWKQRIPSQDPKRKTAVYSNPFKSLQHQLQTAINNPGEYQRLHNKAFGNVNDNWMKSAGLSTMPGKDGGFAIMPEFAPGIIDRVYNPEDLWGQARGYTVSGNTFALTKWKETDRRNGRRSGGVSGGWLEEGNPYGTTKPAMDRVELRLKKLGVMVYLTDEFIADTAGALQADVEKKVSDELLFMLNASMLHGSGAAQPHGMDNSGHRVIVPRTGAGVIEPIDVARMIDRKWTVLPQGKWSWHAHQSLFSQMISMRIGDHAVWINQQGGMQNAWPMLLAGHPIRTLEYASAPGVEGDLRLLNTDDYYTISKGAIQQSSSIHFRFDTDEQALKFTMRVDGRFLEDTQVIPYESPQTVAAGRTFGQPNAAPTQSSMMMLSTI